MSDPATPFVRALLDPSCAVPDGLTGRAGRPAGRRFDIHRNNVAASLVGALHSGFPSVAALLGKANMDRLARAYCRAHPPDDPRMIYYGGGFPDFLAGSGIPEGGGYLPDVARLDLAVRQSYHAADAAPLPHGELARIPERDLPRLRLVLAPALRLVRSPWPVADIRRLALGGGGEKPRAAPQDVLVTRPAYDPQVHVLARGGAEWIAALRQGQGIGAALERAQRAAPDFDMAAPLALLLREGAVVAVKTGKAWETP